MPEDGHYDDLKAFLDARGDALLRFLGGSKMTWAPAIHHVTWLSPTKRNLALLTLTPPTGFTKIPYAELAQKYLGPIS